MLLELLVTLEEVLLNLCGSIGTTVTMQPFCREQLQQWFVAQNKLFERCLVRGGGGRQIMWVWVKKLKVFMKGL